MFLAGCLFTVAYSIRLIKIFCVSLQKINPPLLSKETSLFIFSVSFLTFKGWVTGSLYFWYLLSENRYSIIFTDICIRLLVITTGSLFYNTWNPHSTSKTVFLTMVFLKWRNSRGLTQLKNLIKYQSVDRNWMEICSGRGLFFTMSYLSFYGFFIAAGLTLLIITFFTLVVLITL